MVFILFKKRMKPNSVYVRVKSDNDILKKYGTCPCFLDAMDTIFLSSMSKVLQKRKNRVSKRKMVIFI
jgi:hypothetical protein